MPDPSNAEIKTLLESHMSAAREDRARDAEFRGRLDGTLNTIADEQRALRRDLTQLQTAHDETRRIATAARDSSTDLESRVVGAIARLETTQAAQSNTIAEIKVETAKQTDTLTEMVGELREQKALREERERVAKEAAAAAKEAAAETEKADAKKLAAKKERFEGIKRPLTIAMLVLTLLGAINATVWYVIARARGEKPPPPAIHEPGE